MKIYFAASIRGGRDDVEIYQEILNILRKYGTILTEHVADSKISSIGEEETTQKIYDRDMDWLNNADVFIAEVTTPSLGVGYEISKAEERSIPILCLFRSIEGKSISAMISGNKKLNLMEYKSTRDIEKSLEHFFKSIIH